MKWLILMLVNFMDTIPEPIEIEHDSQRIQDIVTSVWQIAIKSKPVEVVDSEKPNASR